MASEIVRRLTESGSAASYYENRKQAWQDRHFPCTVGCYTWGTGARAIEATIGIPTNGMWPIT